MRATHYYYAILACLRAASASADLPTLNTNRCPSFYTLYGDENAVTNGKPTAGMNLWLIATCSADDTSDEYRTSKLDIGQCYSNIDGDLQPNNIDPDKQNNFVSSCAHIGIGSEVKDDTGYALRLLAACRRDDGGLRAALASMEDIHLNNGVLGCFTHSGTAISYDPTIKPRLFPPKATHEVVKTTTITATNNVTTTLTVVSTAASTAVYTSISTAITTAISSFATPSTVIVTSEHTVTTTKTKIKTKKVTETTQIRNIATKAP
ncbi:hypothetical protein GGS26DRAFT_280141 [Hypomontagnella submonticulosa]|nr:hypothetical protein GGS26DRAFT_280141 [Hypomontagnella submonticulosa]